MLTDTLRADIKAAKKSNPQMSLRELGDMYKLSQTTIHKVLMDQPLTMSKPSNGRRMRTQDNERRSPHDGTMTANYTYHWTPRERDIPLPVVDGGFIKPPTRERLMAGR